MLDTIHQEIDQVVKTNGNKEITAADLNQLLKDMTDVSMKLGFKTILQDGDVLVATDYEYPTIWLAAGPCTFTTVPEEGNERIYNVPTNNGAIIKLKSSPIEGGRYFSVYTFTTCKETPIIQLSEKDVNVGEDDFIVLKNDPTAIIEMHIGDNYTAFLKKEADEPDYLRYSTVVIANENVEYFGIKINKYDKHDITPQLRLLTS